MKAIGTAAGLALWTLIWALGGQPEMIQAQQPPSLTLAEPTAPGGIEAAVDPQVLPPAAAGPTVFPLQKAPVGVLPPSQARRGAVSAAHYSTAAQSMGLGKSRQSYHQNFKDVQRSMPRPNNRVMQDMPGPLTIAIGTRQGAPVNMISAPQGAAAAPAMATDAFAEAPALLFTFATNARSDLVVDSTRLADIVRNDIPFGLLPSRIPVRGEPFFRSGERADVQESQLTGQFGADTLLNTDLGAVRVYTQVDYQASATGRDVLRLRHLWAQMNVIVLGQTHTFFADPDAAPNTLDTAGPNSQVFVQHPLLGYLNSIEIDEARAVSAGLSIEAPEASATIDPAAGDPTTFTSYSHAPDFAVKLRYNDNHRGHIQFSGLIRDIAVEDATSVVRRDVFGWGTRLSSAFYLFRDPCSQRKDIVSFAATYGEGIGNYVLDLRNFGAQDAVLDPNRRLIALPVFGFFGGYTHFWTPRWSSTLVYSEVDLDSRGAAAMAAYRRGRYASINLGYRWTGNAFNITPEAKDYTGFAAVEYLYGNRETATGATGEDHRIQFGVGVNF